MFRMTTRTLSAVLAFMIPALAGAQTEDETLDPVIYEVEAKYPATSYPDGYVLDNNHSWEASTPFDPRYSYTEAEKQAVIESELRVTGGRLVTEPDGSMSIEIVQPEIPEATRDTSPPEEVIYEVDGEIPPPQFQPGDVNNPYPEPAWATRRYLYGKNFGNSLFGAGYSIDTFVKGTEASSTVAKKVSAYIDNKVRATAFSLTKEVMRSRTDVAGQQGGATGGTAKLYSMGQLIYSKNLTGTFSLTPVNLSRSFFSRSKWFMVGIVPVKLTASLVGGVKLSLSGKASATEAKLNATPGGYVNVLASAGVNIFILGFGISGSLTLINLGVPSIAEIVWPACSAASWRLAASSTLKTLSGTLQLWARVNFIFFKKTWYLTIAKWTGITKSFPIFDLSGVIPMGICPG